MTTGHALTFAELLRRHRQAAGLTQEELAERAGLSARSVSDIERGVKSRPHRDTVRLLAEALGLAGSERAAFEAARRRGAAAAPPDRASGGATVAVARRGETLPPFVGRASELALLERHLAGEGPPVLLLAGEPGIGKSRLLQEAKRQALEHGWQVLAGGCQRRGGQHPYAPLLEALEGYITHRSPVDLRADLRGCAWLVRLLPELTGGPIEPLPAWTLPPEQERRLMDRAVGRFLANAAGTAGTLLLLDDLQWAGADALDLLATLVRAAGEPTLRVIGTYRDTEVVPHGALAMAVADLASAALAKQHTLSHLPPDEAEQLLDALLPQGAERGALRERIVQRAEGVPFYLVSYALGLRAGAGERAAGDVVPWDVAQGVRQRVALLPDPAREVLGAAAVIGRVVPPALLVQVVGFDEREVLVALEAATRARLLVEEEERGYRFAHDLIREVAESDVGVARRLALHRRVAQALERQPGEPPIELLAYHYDRAGTVEQAARWLERAGDQAAGVHANGVAIGHYEQARRQYALSGADQRTLARLDEKLGTILTIAGHYDEALATLKRALDAFRQAGDLDGQGRTVVQVGWVHTLRATPDAGIEQIERFLDILATSDLSPRLADLYNTLSLLLFTSGRYAEAEVASESAINIARTLEDKHSLARSQVYRANAVGLMGRYEEVLRIGEEAIPLLEASGDFLHLVQALVDVGEAQAFRGEFDVSEVTYERAREVAERLGEAGFMTMAIAYGAWVALMHGNWNEASTKVKQAVTITRQREASWFAPYPLFKQGALLLAQGDWEQASDCLKEASAMAERIADLQALRGIASLLAELDILHGRPEAARVRLAPLLDRPSLEESNVTQFLPVLAWAHLETGEVAQAAEVVAQAIARMRPENLRAVLVDALRVQALVAIRQRRWEEATVSLEEGLELARAMPYPYAEGRLLHVYGEMHVQKGEAELACGHLEAALAIFRRLGARIDIERVEQALATTNG